MADMPDKVGRYEVERRIGQGGMGVVYLARDTTLDRAVAIKALPEAVAADADRLMRFEREAKLLAALNHAHIAAIYGLEQGDGGEPYLVLEYVEGETLVERMARGAMPVEEALASLRVSFGMTNTAAEVEALLAVLAVAVSELRSADSVRRLADARRAAV